MLQRLLVLAVRSYVRGPAKSWVFTTLATLAFRQARKTVGRRPVVETLSVKPGQQIVIDGLTVSHKRQIKDIKHDKKAQKRAAKAAKRADKEARRQAS